MSVAVGKHFKMKGFRTSITVSSLVITSDLALVDFRRSSEFLLPCFTLLKENSASSVELFLQTELSPFSSLPQTSRTSRSLRSTPSLLTFESPARASLSMYPVSSPPFSYLLERVCTRPQPYFFLAGNEIVGVGAFATYHPPEIAPSEYPVPDLRPKRQAHGKASQPMVESDDEDRSRPPTRSAEEMDEAEEQAREFLSFSRSRRAQS